MQKYIQITSGRGPVECTRVVQLVFKKIVEAAEKAGIELTVLDADNEFSITCTLNGDDSKVISFENDWKGSVLWIATKNPYRPHHKRKNWFVGINFYSAKDYNISIDEKDIKIDTIRGKVHAGGQHQNTTDSCVRITHVPTGITVMSSDERSQTQNKKIAMERLVLKMLELKAKEKSSDDYDIWMNHNSLQRGNPVKTFKGDL